MGSDQSGVNPKHLQGILKAPMHNLPAPVMMEVGVAMLEGALKYGPYNFRDTKISASTYYSALWRHIAAWWEGEDIDAACGQLEGGELVVTGTSPTGASCGGGGEVAPEMSTPSFFHW